MQDLNDKVTGGTLSASEWNQVPSELQNVIEAIGQTLSGADLNQLGKAIAGYAASGKFYTDTGAADAYVLGTIGSRHAPHAYIDGMEIIFSPGNTNTGASTVNVSTLGVKDLRDYAGAVLVAGALTAGSQVQFVYNASAGHFRLKRSSFVNRLLSAATAALARTAVAIQNPHAVCDGRLTLTSGTPVTTADVTAATNVYFTPHIGNQVAVYSGGDWIPLTFSELTLAVPATTGTNYDVFAYDNSGVLAIEALAWTNDTTRATALAKQDGVYVKSGAVTRRYLGTFRTTTVSGQTEDSTDFRYVWNYYNRVDRTLYANSGATVYAYTTDAYRLVNNDAANQVKIVVGVDEDEISAKAFHSAANTNTGVNFTTGIGLDSTSAPVSASLTDNPVTLLANQRTTAKAAWNGHCGVGLHSITWLERSVASGTTTWTANSGETRGGLFGNMKG
jgi:hypothetical protein